MLGRNVSFEEVIFHIEQGSLLYNKLDRMLNRGCVDSISIRYII